MKNYFGFVRKKLDLIFLAIGSKYFGIFFVNLIPENDMNPDIVEKNLSLYKLEFSVAFLR